MFMLKKIENENYIIGFLKEFIMQNDTPFNFKIFSQIFILDLMFWMVCRKIHYCNLKYSFILRLYKKILKIYIKSLRFRRNYYTKKFEKC
ncbi:hypothetical protein [Campylobacter jejuni]|uniref:hypothetical protein n=2 Tax=Campylobacter jejuni TaxID=197 RepID=UPI000F8104A3|nr:hypothetical protein [Campylobacter jejuni]ECQ9248009.1 hypothetical protein [Campylobacter jejuni]EJQ9502246.1 hypothetical protein [Campylobacter jejuni]EKZ7239917.1 hypothetical protein [Campylobacter jejuni]QIW67028.1 hypothetical protein G3T48_05490 [Campylobacter jejuni]RTI53469.1 hypothetical protein C3I24_00805 [Campylobacter jejuni]